MILTDPEEFLQLATRYPVIDVRSPGEFASGHIPGAVNLPLFENEERSIVGILYKNKGRQEAIRKGLELVGPKMTLLVDQAIALAAQGHILVHCWRGGMRSSSVAWLFESSGLEVRVLQGGYRAYRRYIRSQLPGARKLLVVGGMTGSGKTRLLRLLSQAGEPVIDLEGLANHRGSAFGSVGLGAQPSTEHFENLLYQAMADFPDQTCVWVEDESRRVGDVFLPESFHAELRKSRVYAIHVSDEERIRNIFNEYAPHSNQELLQAIALLRKRLGGLLTDQADDLIRQHKYETVIRLLLPYYDKRYRYGLSKRNPSQTQEVDLEYLSDSERITLFKKLRLTAEEEIF